MRALPRVLRSTFIASVVALVVPGAAIAGCGGGSGIAACVDGEACLCPDGGAGYQVCLAGASSCVCDGTMPRDGQFATGDCDSGVSTSTPDLVLLPLSCLDGVMNGDESAVDCGGKTCPACGTGRDCLHGSDCQSRSCTNNACDAPTCSDGFHNGAESDVDCGGPTCPKCAQGKGCSSGSDCALGNCANNLCALSQCQDQKLSGDETDVDCGGATCAPCGLGKNCLRGVDCGTGICSNNLCKVAAGCDDKIKNGLESDVDCGGNCGKCPVGGACLSASDCTTANCANNLCTVAQTCTDGQADGSETDVDCGGGCAKCAGGKTCLVAADCASGQCQGGACAAVTQLCPNIMLVLDRSGSMSSDPSGGGTVPSKWQLLQMAVKQVLLTYGGTIDFGLEMFTSSGFDDASCYSDAVIDVEPAASTATSIDQKVSVAMPDSGTNTGEAIRRAAVDKALHDAGRQNYIVLVTDGDPTCNSGDQAGTADYTIAQIKMAAAQSPSVHTFVVGFDGSGGVNPANLNNMAKAGQEPIAGCASTAAKPCYYAGSDATKFNQAMLLVIDTIQKNGGGAACTP